MLGLTAVGVRLAEVGRCGRLNRQLRHGHLTCHRVSAPQAAHSAAVFSVRAHLEKQRAETQSSEKSEPHRSELMFLVVHIFSDCFVNELHIEVLSKC